MIKCPDCGGGTVKRKGPYGHFYGCDSYPKCKGVISCDKDGKLTVAPADKNNRKLRTEAHAIFDQLWKKKLYTHTNAYRWLQIITNLPAKDAHIGKFDSKQCELVIANAKIKLKEPL